MVPWGLQMDNCSAPRSYSPCCRVPDIVPGGGSSVLVSTGLARVAVGFTTTCRAAEDWDMWVRLARLSPMVYLDQPLAAWRMWEGQGSTDAPLAPRSSNKVRSTYFPELGQVDDRYAVGLWASAARRYLAAGDRVQASKHFLQLAHVSKAPGQLAYALGALVAPGVTEKRLERIEPCPDPAWRAPSRALVNQEFSRKCLTPPHCLRGRVSTYRWPCRVRAIRTRLETTRPSHADSYRLSLPTIRRCAPRRWCFPPLVHHASFKEPQD